MDKLDTLSQLGTRIAYLRKERNMTLLSLSLESGIATSYLSDMEHGRRNPSFLTLEKISEAFGITMSDLLLGISKVI